MKRAWMHVLASNIKIANDRATRLKGLVDADELKNVKTALDASKQKWVGKPFNVGPLNRGMKNLTIASSPEDTDLDKILDKLDRKGLQSNDTFETTSCTFRGRTNFEQLVTFIKDHEPSGDKTKERMSAWFSIRDKRTDKSTLITVFYSGKVTMKTAGNPSEVRAFFEKTYRLIPGPMTLNSESITFQMLGLGDLRPDVKAISEALKQATVGDDELDTEFGVKAGKQRKKQAGIPTHEVYIDIGKTIRFMLAANSTTVTVGRIPVDDQDASVKKIVKVLKTLRDNDYFTNPRSRSSGGNRSGSSGNGNRSGPAKKKQVLDRKTGNTCEKSRRPDPAGSFTGKCPHEGCFVKPNPQGFPCCYSLKGKNANGRVVKKAYAKHKVAIPQSLKNLLKLTNSPVSVGSANRKLVFEDMNGKNFRIDGKLCRDTPRALLADYAVGLGITVKKSMRIADLCRLLQEKGKNEAPQVPVMQQIRANWAKAKAEQNKKNSENRKAREANQARLAEIRAEQAPTHRPGVRRARQAQQADSASPSPKSKSKSPSPKSKSKSSSSSGGTPIVRRGTKVVVKKINNSQSLSPIPFLKKQRAQRSPTIVISNSNSPSPKKQKLQAPRRKKVLLKNSPSLSKMTRAQRMAFFQQMLNRGNHPSNLYKNGEMMAPSVQQNLENFLVNQGR